MRREEDQHDILTISLNDGNGAATDPVLLTEAGTFGRIRIKSGQPMESVFIEDLSGRIISHFGIKDWDTLLDLPPLTPVFFLIRITFNGSKSTVQSILVL